MGLREGLLLFNVMLGDGKHLRSEFIASRGFVLLALNY